MSIDSVDRANIEANTDALHNTLNLGSLDIFGARENQANKIFRNLDQFEDRGGNDYEQAVEEYRKVFDQYNKSNDSDDLPDLKLVDYDNDGDMDIQLVEDGKAVKTFTHK